MQALPSLQDEVPPVAASISDVAPMDGNEQQQLDSNITDSFDESAGAVTSSNFIPANYEHAINPVPAPIPDDDGVEAGATVGTKPKLEKMKWRENRRKTFIAEAFIDDEVDVPAAAAPSKPSAAMQSMPLSMPVNFDPLDIAGLKKYKKCFKEPLKANACKEELLSVIAKHFFAAKS